MSELLKIAVDDGYAQTKVARMSDGQIKTHAIPSRATNGIEAADTDLMGNHVSTYQTPRHDGQSSQMDTFCVTANATDCDTRYEGYSTSTMNRCIIHDAIAASGLAAEEGGDIHLTVTLPIGHYFSDHRAALIEARQKSLMQPVVQLKGTDSLHPMFSIKKVSVMPEAAMAYVDYLVADDGGEANDPNETVAVIDVGGNTTDIALMLPNMNIQQRRSGSINMGVLNLFEEINRLIIRNYDSLPKGLPPAKIEEALKRSGITNVRGERTDFSPIIQEAIERLAQNLRTEVGKIIQDDADVDRLIYVGGGAMIMGGTLTRHPSVFVPNEPHMANARGALKYVIHGS